MIVRKDYVTSRNELYDLLRAHHIYARKYFYPLTSDQACFKNQYKKVGLENARRLAEQILILPLYEKLKLCQMDEIINVINCI